MVFLLRSTCTPGLRRPIGTASSILRPSHALNRTGLCLAGGGFSLRLRHVPPRLERGYANSYGQPQGSFSAVNVLYGLMGVNVGVWLYYKYLVMQAQQGAPNPLKTFVQNMTLNLTNVRDHGMWWTTITSVFTHFGGFHLLGNMLSIYYFGELLAYTPGVGPAKFLTLVLGAGLTGNLGYLYQRSERTKNTNGVDFNRGLGFSGAVMGVGAAAACLYPRVQFLIYGIVPVPLWALIGGYALYDGYYLQSERTGVAHSGHLGGMAFGLLYYFAVLRGMRRF